MTAPTLSDLARRGDVDGLVSELDLAPDSRRDRDVYTWLLYAIDLGHPGAEEALADVMERSWLRHDPGHSAAAAHWELAVAYLEGSDGVTVDHERAVAHLDDALFSFDLSAIAEETGERYDAAALLARLPEDARAVLSRHLEAGIFVSRVRIRLSRLRRLAALDAPEIVFVHETGLLEEAFAALARSPAAAESEALQREAAAFLALR